MFVSTTPVSMVDAVDVRQAAQRARGRSVVVGQPVHVVVERVQAAGAGDPGLAQRAAQHLLVAPRFGDQLLGAGHDGADRGAEAFVKSIQAVSKPDA